MNLKSLKIFCDIVSRRSFSRAAEENGISQSGASQVVSQLESRLGVQLIERSKRPLVPTVEGRVFFDGCRKIVAGMTLWKMRFAPFTTMWLAGCGWRPSIQSGFTT